MIFTDFQLDERILKGIEKAGFTQCTEVQAETLKSSLNGKDVLVQSQTGTGKTAAFIIPIYHLLQTKEELKNKKVLILAPTRELVLQIEKEAKLLGSFVDLKIGSFYGGVGYNQQEEMLREGVNVIIGTPGRLIDFAGSGKIKFGDFGILVIDEADRMFDMGFYPDIKRMLKRMAPPDKRISMLFSATLSTRVKNLAWEFMNEPVEVNLSPDQITVDKIDQVLYHVGGNEKIRLLLGIMKQRNPQNVLIFTNTKHEAMRVAGKLSGNGYECDFIIGDLPQKRRTRIIDNIKSGKLRCLVATDVAARGLHINDLDLVINYDIPEDFESYVHRIGRTARAGKSGIAVTLACEKFVYGLEAIESFIKMKLPVEWASEDLYLEDLCPEDYLRNFMRANKAGREMPQKGERGGRGERKPAAARPKTDRTRPERERKTSVAAGPQKTRPAAKAAETSKPAARRTETAHAGKNGKHTADIKDKKAAAVKTIKQPERSKKDTKKTNLDARMKYYKEKYGEDFVVSREVNVSPDDKGKRSILDKVKSLFKRNK